MSGVDVRPYELLRPIMKLWYLLALESSRSAAAPRDEPTARVQGDDTDAVLVIGNGAASGWGVLTHQLALTGQLSRAISSATTRPCAVHYIGDEMMNLASATAWIGDHDLSLYDAVVVMIGVNDAVRLTPIAAWRSQLATLLDSVQNRVRPGARVVVAGIQPIRSISFYDHAFGAVAEWHRRRLNQELVAAATEREDVEFFELPAPEHEPDRRWGSEPVYRSWARDVTTVVAPALALARAAERTPRRQRSIPEREFGWSGAAALVQNAVSGGSAEMQRLAAEAEDEFHVDIAVVSLLDGKQLYYAMRTEILPVSIPRELSFCDRTVATDAVHIVPDSRKDDRYSGNPYLELTHGYFYAGYPVHASTGEAIGAFCLHSIRPRGERSIDVDKLRAFALRAEKELQSYESGETVLSPASQSRAEMSWH